MKTLVLEHPGKLSLKATAAPARVGDGEALVGVRAVGICGTDIHAYGGRQPFFDYPRILGHELGVEVLETGAKGLQPGDRCAVEPYLNCGECPACREGRTNCCETLACMGVHVDGGMREQILVPVEKLHRSGSLDFESLALVETLGIGKHAVDRAGISEKDTVAIIGLGPIGLTAAQFALLAGARIVGIDISDSRIESARRLFPETLETLRLDENETLEEQWLSRVGSFPDVVIEATGNRKSMERCFSLPRNGGRVALVGLVQGEMSWNVPNAHRRELTTFNSRNSTARDFREILSLMEAGRIRVDSWITHRTAADKLPGVIDEWIKPGAGMLKGMISF